MRINKTAPGFSLLEIVFAITIMAIIAAIIIPTIMNYVRQAKVKTTRIAIKNVQSAIELYKTDTGQYPSILDDLQSKPADEKVARSWDGPYVKKGLRDAWGSEFVFQLNPKGTQPPYELYSWGQNKEGSPEEEWIRARED